MSVFGNVASSILFTLLFPRVCGGNQYDLDHLIKNALFLQNLRNVQGVIPCVLCLAVGWFLQRNFPLSGYQKKPLHVQGRFGYTVSQISFSNFRLCRIP